MKFRRTEPAVFPHSPGTLGIRLTPKYRPRS